MTYALITPPLAEALALGEVKAHLRLTGADEDVLLGALIRTARMHLERTTGLVLISRSWRMVADDLPPQGILTLTRGPVTRIVSATVYGPGGLATKLDLTGVLFERGPPGRVMLGPLPAGGLGIGLAINGFEVDFIAGFGATGAEVPDGLKQAMLMHVATMYAYRGAVTPEDQPAALPNGYGLLVAPYRSGRL